MDRKDSGMGGCQPKGIKDVLKGGGTGCAAIHDRYVGADPLHRTAPGMFPTQGCKIDNKNTAKDTGKGGMGISAAGGSAGGGGL